MIKFFFAHVCLEKKDETHQFLEWISERFRKDLPPFETFISCKSTGWTDANDLNASVDDCHFFVPIVTAQYPNKPNCVAELDRARSRKKSTGVFPVILAVRFGPGVGDAMLRLDFNIDQASSEGEKWIEFDTPETWDTPYEDLLRRILDAVLKHRLTGKHDFYQDCEHLDLIAEREIPTAFEIKSAMELCRKEEYGSYFFKHLDRKEWLFYLKPFRFFKDNPPPREVPKQAGAYLVPHWPVLEFLQKVSTECSGSENRRYAQELIEIIREVTNPKDGPRVENDRTWWYFVKIISNVPTNLVRLQDIDLVDDWLECRFQSDLVGDELGTSFLPKLLRSDLESDWAKAAKLLAIVTRIRSLKAEPTENDLQREPKTRIRPHYLSELLDNNAVLLGQRCGKLAVEVLLERLKEVLTPANDDEFSYIWYKAIEDDQRNVGRHSAKNLLTTALRNVLLSYSKACPEEAQQTLSDLLDETLNVPRRIALYVIDKSFDTNQNLFWTALNPELFDINFEHELKQLFKTHFCFFTEQRQNHIVSLMESLTRNWREEADKELFDARLRARWLESIKGQGSEKADELYKQCVAFIKSKPDSSQLVPSAGVGFGQVSTKGPISSEMFLKMSVSELIEFLNLFKQTGYLGDPTEDGLADLLSNAVNEQPERYETDLDAFLKCKPIYQLALLGGYEQRWRGRKPFRWDKVLDFCWLVLNSELFKGNEEDSDASEGRSTRGSLTGTISSLIESGVKSDEWAFDEAQLPMAERVIIRMLDEESPVTSQRKTETGAQPHLLQILKYQDPDPWKKDAVTQAMNTARGRSLEALINYSLRQARLADRKKQNTNLFWQSIQAVFDRELERCRVGNFEFSALAGLYLPNLYYLSKDWVESNINELFPQDHNVNWLCAIQGYSYVNTVYKPIYELLKLNGHFAKTLEYEFANSQVLPRIIQNIAIAYVSGWESLSEADGLFRGVLEDWRKDHITEIINCLWMYREGTVDEKVRERILSFWKCCFNRIDKQEQQNQDTLSHLNLLTVFLTQISEEEKGWLLQCAPFVDVHHHAPFLIEYLEGLVDQNPAAVGEVYLRMLTNTVPTYDENHIHSIVESLFEAGCREQANEICDRYARAGFPAMLKGLHDKYN